MINNEFLLLKKNTTFLYSTEFNFLNLFALTSKLFESDESELLKYNKLLDRSGVIIQNFNKTNKWDIVELNESLYFKLIMNYFSGCDYVYYVMEFRKILHFNIIPVKFHSLIDIAGRYGNELGIEIIAEMDDLTLLQLYKTLRVHSEELQEWLSNFSKEITTEVYIFIKLNQLFNEFPYEKIKFLENEQF